MPPPTTVPAPGFFFLHIMKTAGGTFTWDIRANFDDTQVYPDRRADGADPDKYLATTSVDYLLGLSADRHRSISVYTGHFPFVVTELLDRELTTLTVLRDPVERTISHLRHRRDRVPGYRDQPLEAIYEDPVFFRCNLQNHQAKMFAFTPNDRPRTYLDELDVDDARLERAKANLGSVDLVGLTEEFGRFRHEVAARLGWSTGRAKPVHVSDDQSDVARALRKRIAADNEADLELYRFAQGLAVR